MFRTGIRRALAALRADRREPIARIRRTAAAQILEQEDHFMIFVRGMTSVTAVRHLPIACNPLGPLRPGRAGFAGRVQNAGSQKFRDELQFVRGQALDETPGPGPIRTIGTRNQGRYQSVSHGRTPVGEEPYSFFTGSGRIMAKTGTGRKGRGRLRRALVCNPVAGYRRLCEYWWRVEPPPRPERSPVL